MILNGGVKTPGSYYIDGKISINIKELERFSRNHDIKNK